MSDVQYYMYYQILRKNEYESLDNLTDFLKPLIEFNASVCNPEAFKAYLDFKQDEEQSEKTKSKHGHMEESVKDGEITGLHNSVTGVSVSNEDIDNMMNTIDGSVKQSDDELNSFIPDGSIISE